MSKGWGSKAIYLRLLVWVVAIQAMTPDANDLSSPALFRLICVPADMAIDHRSADSLLSETAEPARSPDGGGLPASSPEDDQLPDEICVPRSQTRDAVPHHSSGTLIRLSTLSPHDADAPTTGPGAPRSGTCSRSRSRAGLNLLFGRLIC